MANKKVAAELVPEEEEEYPGALVYNMWIENMTITVNDGGQVILQTGKPAPWPPPQ